MRALRAAAGLAALIVAARPHGPALRAQEPLPQFDVASVKPSQAPPASSFSWALRPTGVAITNLTLRQILSHAFGFGMAIGSADQTKWRLVGGPESLLESRFDITTRAPEGTTPAQVPLMLRALLAERFKMRVHEEMRPLPVYALVVRRPGQLGPKLKPFAYDCSKGWMNVPVEAQPVCRPAAGSSVPRGGAITIATGGPMSLLIARVQGFVDRMVVDGTGLAGNYAWEVTHSITGETGSEHPGVFTAFEEQLGLRFEGRTAPVPVVMIDHIEAPSPD